MNERTDAFWEHNDPDALPFELTDGRRVDGPGLLLRDDESEDCSRNRRGDRVRTSAGPITWPICWGRSIAHRSRCFPARRRRRAARCCRQPAVVALLPEMLGRCHFAAHRRRRPAVAAPYPGCWAIVSQPVVVALR